MIRFFIIKIAAEADKIKRANKSTGCFFSTLSLRIRFGACSGMCKIRLKNAVIIPLNRLKSSIGPKRE